MPELSTILCPVDQSEISRRALAYAVALARAHGARVHVVEVLEQPIAPLATGPVIYEFPAGVRTASHEALRRFAAPAMAAGVVEGIRLRVGHVVGEILRDAAECGADFLVLGTHGRSGFARMALGSVAEKILHTAACPVLAVPPGDEHPPDRPFRTVLCPTDFSPAADNAIAYARFIARCGGTTDLLLAHVVEWAFGTGDGTDPVSELRRSLEAEARDQLAALTAADPDTDLAVRTVVASGKPAREIVALARARLADLIVMGVTGRGALDLALLGSTTHRVVRQAPCPVLTVPDAYRRETAGRR